MDAFPDRPAPVLVTSPAIRSGSTLLQRLLCSSPDAIVFGEEIGKDLDLQLQILASRQLVLINPHGLRTNLERLSASLADRGLRPDGRPLAASDDALAQAFSGAAGEAQLVLVRRDGTTSAVLTLRSRQP